MGPSSDFFIRWKDYFVETHDGDFPSLSVEGTVERGIEDFSVRGSRSSRSLSGGQYDPFGDRNFSGSKSGVKVYHGLLRR